MVVSFDGNDIIRHSEIDIESYKKWKTQHDEKLNHILIKESRQNMSVSVNNWMDSLPDEYKNASIKGLSKYDPAAGEIMDEEMRFSIKKNHPKNIIIHSTTESSGKTWALYAWIEDLVRNKVITNPADEIKVISENELSDILQTYNISIDINTKQRKFKEVFTPSRKVLAITDCGVLNDLRKSRRIDLWSKVMSNIKGTKMSFVCTMAHQIGDNATPIMQDEVVAMEKIIKRSTIVNITEEVSR